MNRNVAKKVFTFPFSLFSLIAVFTFSISLFTSCEKYDHAIADIEDRLDKIENTSLATIDRQIGDLKAVDTELKDKIESLETIATDLQSKLDAANTALAALESDLDGQISASEQKVLNQLATEKAALEGELATINNTIATLTSQLTAIEDKITSLESAVAACATQEELDEVKQELATVQSEMATIKTAVEELQKRVTDIEGEADSLQTAVADLESSIKDLESNFVSRIQGLTYIPTHTDGKATMADNATSGKCEAELSFFVMPKSVVGNITQEHISAKGVYTAATRAMNLIDLSVSAFESDADNGTITVTISGDNLTNFLSGISDAAVFLIISDDNSEFISDYVPLAMDPGYIYDQASNTYTVYTAKGLYAWNEALETDLTANLVIAADITLPNKDLSTGEEITITDNKPSGSNWNPFGYYDRSVFEYTKYNGTIDGGGHTISGMRINTTNENSGFVQVLGGSGSIKNLVIDDVVIYSTNQDVAAFAGNNYGIIENCHVKGETSSIYGASEAGGIAGYANNHDGDVEIIACSNMATVTTDDAACGGIVGETYKYYSHYSLNVIGCWTKDTNESYGQRDGIGINNEASVSGVFSVADATAANSKITEMNQALEGAGCSYRWETVAGGWPEIKK